MLYRAVLVFITVLQKVNCDPFEDTFLKFGCNGTYDKYEIVHLERICDECYEIYKEQDIHFDCRFHCYGTIRFFECMVTVALNKQRKQQVMHSWNIIKRKN